MNVIPLLSTPSQNLAVTLANQAVRLSIYQRIAPSYMLSKALYIDVLLNDQLVVGGTLCLEMNRIIRDRYFGFAGDFFFWDSTGAREDPYWTGLGARWQLFWGAADELPAVTRLR